MEVTNFGKTPPSCYQVCDGTAFVEVKGGTAPYIYQWNDAQKQTEAKAISLCTGNYTVTVTDANGCQITQTIEIEETPELTLEVINTQEISCFEGCNGKVQVQANGGTGKYSYTWSHDESVNQSAASNLCQGTYSITVTDKNGCEATTEVVLTHPDQLQSELPSEVYVCNDKGTQLDAGKDWAGYSWENEFGEELGTNRILENAQVGTYTLYTFNEEGCMLQDEIEVGQSERYFVGNFVMPTVTEVGKEVHLADISWPKPDAVEWVIKEGSPTVLEETNYGKTLQFHQAGEYTVAFTAQLGECVDYLEKKIEVYPPATSPQTPPVVDLQDEIFVLYPNPNNGRFTVGIRLKEVQDVTLKVYGLYAPGMILEEKTVKGQQDYEVPFQMRLPAGAYVVTIQTQNTIKHISFIKE